jgi:hypothetical protein
MQTPQEVSAWADLADKLTVIVLLVTMLIGSLLGLYRRWWVPGWLYTQALDEAAMWRSSTITLMATTDRAIEVAKQTSAKD